MPFSFDNTFARLPEAFYARTQPMPVSDPHLIELNRDLASQLGLDMNRLESPEVLAILSGNRWPARHPIEGLGPHAIFP